MKFAKQENQVQNDQYANYNTQLLMEINMMQDSNLDIESAYQIAVKESFKQMF